MDHDRIKQILFEQADGDYLSADDLAAAREHIVLCPECADEIKLWKNLRAGLREMEIPRAASSINHNVMRQIDQEASRTGLPSTQAWAAALALAALLIYSAIPYGGSAQPASEPYSYASAGELGFEGILSGSSLEPVETAETLRDAADTPGEI